MRSQCVRRPPPALSLSERTPARPLQGTGGLGLPLTAAVPVLDLSNLLGRSALATRGAAGSDLSAGSVTGARLRALSLREDIRVVCDSVTLRDPAEQHANPDARPCNEDKGCKKGQQRT